jgi:Undecaprenyl-phosphate glucose phosphotransferase
MTADAASPPSGDARPANRRGPFRPAVLASSRARLEARALLRLFLGLEAGAVVLLAATCAALAQPRGLLLAPVASLLPYVIGAPLMVMAIGWSHEAPSGLAAWRVLLRAAALLLLAGAALAPVLAWLPLARGERSAVVDWFALSAAVVLLLHMLWLMRRARLRREGKLAPHVVVVGATANAERLIAHAHARRDVAVLGIFDDRAGRIPEAVGGVPVLGDTQALLGHRIMPFVDRVVIAVPSGAQERVGHLIARLRPLPNELLLLLDADGAGAAQEAVARLAGLPLARVSGHPQQMGGVLAKRAQDLLIAALALLVTAPFMLAIAVAVKLDSPGPVFFRQRRHGFNNEVITVWKFRSMRHEAADATASQQVQAGDPRVTRVGRLIRRTSLDELPQLFNVLRGDMSLVGPRPHAIGMRTEGRESAELVAEYAHRHRMKPGITSWAAIHGSRGPVATAEAVRRRVALDVEYIERQSFWLDIYILARTLPCLLGDREAVR